MGKKEKEFFTKTVLINWFENDFLEAKSKSDWHEIIDIDGIFLCAQVYVSKTFDKLPLLPIFFTNWPSKNCDSCQNCDKEVV